MGPQPGWTVEVPGLAAVLAAGGPAEAEPMEADLWPAEEALAPTAERPPKRAARQYQLPLNRTPPAMPAAHTMQELRAFET
jgi:hypothetical protein